MEWRGFQIIENKDVPKDQVWFVAPPRNHLDKRPATQRVVRVVNLPPDEPQS